MGGLKNVNRKNGIEINQPYRQVYVHRLWKSYKPRYQNANISKMNSDTYKIYKEQSNRLKNTFARHNNIDMKEAADSLKTIEEVLNGITINSNALTSENIFKEEQYKIDGKSFYSYSSSAKQREKLFKDDLTKIQEFVTKLDSAISAYEGISETNRKYVESEVIKQGVSIPTKEMAEAMNNIYSDGKADKGLKKIVASNLLLKKYAGLLPAEKSALLPNISDNDANEIVRGLSGSLNGLSGGFFEIAVNSLLNNAGKEFFDSIKGEGVEIISSELSGERHIRTKSLGGKKVTSKSDLKVTANINGLTAELGLSLKTANPKSAKDTKKKATIVHSGNLGHLIQRANAFMEESTYHLVNSAAHKSYQSAVYKAAKAKLAAILAFDALAGLGSKSDTAYFIVYQTKIVNIADYLNQLSRPTGNTPPLNITIHDTGGFKAQAKKLKKGNSQVERYVRSKEAMNIFLGLKATLSI